MPKDTYLSKNDIREISSKYEQDQKIITYLLDKYGKFITLESLSIAHKYQKSPKSVAYLLDAYGKSITLESLSIAHKYQKSPKSVAYLLDTYGKAVTLESFTVAREHRKSPKTVAYLLDTYGKAVTLESFTVAREYGYNFTLIANWLDYFGFSKTQSLLAHLKKPYSSLWVQVNTSRIDTDSLIRIFEEMDLDVKKNTHFDDILEVKVKKNDLAEDQNSYSYPKIFVNRESAQSIALGRNIFTNNIIKHDVFHKGDKVSIVDHNNNLIAIGKAIVNSNEVDSLEFSVIANVVQSLGSDPPVTELQYYRRGYYNILTPAQVIGVKSMYLDSLENILVMSIDRGDVAGYIAELTKHQYPITIVAQNTNHVRIIQRQLERINSKAIRVTTSPFYDFLNDKHTIKYTSVYLELPNSRTCVMPTFSSNLSIFRMKKMIKKQKKIVSDMYRCLHPNASISMVNHSLDPLENEKLFDDIISKSYFEYQAFPEDLRILQNKDILKPRSIIEDYPIAKKLAHQSSTIYLDPLEIDNTGGFVSKFKFVLRKNGSKV